MSVVAKRKTALTYLLKQFAKDLEKKFPGVVVDYRGASALPEEGLEAVANAYNVPADRFFEFLDLASGNTERAYSEYGYSICIVPHSVEATKKHYWPELVKLLSQRSSKMEIQEVALPQKAKKK